MLIFILLFIHFFTLEVEKKTENEDNTFLSMVGLCVFFFSNNIIFDFKVIEAFSIIFCQNKIVTIEDITIDKSI